MKCSPHVNDWVMQTAALPVCIVPEERIKPAGSGKKYTVAYVPMEVARDPTWHVYNTFTPLAIIVMGIRVAYAMPPEDLSDRQGIILTLFLTIVAFKFTLSTEIPRLPYLTFMDMVCHS